MSGTKVYDIVGCEIGMSMIPKPKKLTVRTTSDKVGKSLSIQVGEKLYMIPMDEIWRDFKN